MRPTGLRVMLLDGNGMRTKTTWEAVKRALPTLTLENAVVSVREVTDYQYY